MDTTQPVPVQEENLPKAKQTALPPALVDMIIDSPENGRAYFTAGAVYTLHDLFLKRHHMSPTQALEVAKEYAKLARMYPEKVDAGAAGGGVTISINIPAVDAAPSRTITIEQPAEEAPTFEIPVAVDEPESDDGAAA